MTDNEILTTIINTFTNFKITISLIVILILGIWANRQNGY